MPGGKGLIFAVDHGTLANVMVALSLDRKCNWGGVVKEDKRMI